jgi:predicted component of type VI protein secretion system
VKPALLRFVAAAAVAFALAGCSTVNEDSPTTLIPNKTLNISPSLTIPAETLAAIGVIFWFVDPLAPNWRVEVEALGEQRFRVAMTMKRFIIGGEGEVLPVLKRTAEKLRRDTASREFVIVELSEGIQSRVPVAQRVAHAVVQLQ